MGHKKQMKTMPKRITTIKDLKEYGFGQPWPRHGLKLLYWFANDCLWVTDDDDMFLACDPVKGVFGFHLFENKEKLLPEVDFPYYLLGNLNSPGADMLRMLIMFVSGVCLELELEPAAHYIDEKVTSKKRSDVSVDTDTPSRNCVCSCTIL